MQPIPLCADPILSQELSDYNLSFLVICAVGELQVLGCLGHY
jgi:hypothetical protein